MHSLLKSTILGVGLIVGVGAAAHAQSVSALPPTNPAPVPTATTPPVVSTAKIYPNPGVNGEWKEEHHQATESDNDNGRHPYSVGHFGPPPN
jgi:hypothetical protein